MSKFQARFVVLLLAAATLAGTVLAADWPATQPIKLIVPSSAGGTPDLTSRKLAYYLQDKLKQSVIVENRPGAAGTIAMARRTDSSVGVVMASSNALVCSELQLS